tara:strand:+ start:5833 stop:7143 length:1311 start_codon:yes stop_codon:yes gene_type:complete
MKPLPKLLVGIIAGSCLFAANMATASDALLNTLVRKGYLTQDEAMDLRSDHAVNTQDPDSNIHLFGLMQAQYDWVNTEAKDTENPAAQNNFNMRRLYLGTKATMSDQWSATLVADLSNEGTKKIDRAFISYDWRPEANFRFGFAKTPFGHENTTNVANRKRVEISPLLGFFADALMMTGRYTGIFVDGEWGEDNWLYYSGALTNSDRNNAFETGIKSTGSTAGLINNVSDNTPAFWARVGVRGDWNDANYDLGLNAGYLRNQRQKGSNGTQDKVYGAYLAGDWHEFALNAEFMGASISNATVNAAGTADNTTANVWGVNVVPSMRFMEDYELVLGYSYIKAKSLGAQTGAATEPFGVPASKAIRRSTAALTGVTETGYEKLHAYYIGANWYIMDNDLKLGIGYEYAKAEDRVDVSATTRPNDVKIHALRARLQFLF